MADKPRSPWRPPEDTPPARLFRLLIRRPRPWQPIAYRYPGALHVALHVRALTPPELAEALDVDAGDTPDAVVSDTALSRVIVAGLWEDRGPVFTSTEQADRMPHREWSRLMDAALRGLGAVMPTRALCSVDDWKAWRATLLKGALHPSNLGEVFRMRDCVDIAIGWSGHSKRPRPDRYYGLPVADITEGQQLAFEIAAEAAEEATKRARTTNEPE